MAGEEGGEDGAHDSSIVTGILNQRKKRALYNSNRAGNNNRSGNSNNAGPPSLTGLFSLLLELVYT
jgi:hypothetical protein